ncbi:hypothetical protein [Streptomyces noursei]|uniref:hypothetical protein n=1 Tax=Streptomyces noursei TaxID=1971 RepID=UPI00380F2A46
MGDIERPELLPDCDLPPGDRAPDDFVLTCLVRLADEALGDSWRISSLQACELRGGAALAAASFMVQTLGGPWHEDLQRILRLSGVNVDRPPYSYSEYTVGLCYVAGAKGLPTGLRHRAADALVHRANDAGYAEARNLLPKNGWGWLADAVHEGWAIWTANLFARDETAPLTVRMKVGLALAEHESPTGYIPEAVERLVAHRDAASADRLALAVAVAQRAPKNSTDLLCQLAADPLIQAGHRLEAIGLLETVDPAKAQEMRAAQIGLPPIRVAREQRREAVEREKHEVAAKLERETPEAVAGRLDTKIEEILDDLRSRGSADWLADGLDDHIAETDWAGVAQDIADICGLVRDEDVESDLRLLEILTQVRYGDNANSMPGTSEPKAPGNQDFPHLTREELEQYARERAEHLWALWKGLVEKHGWDGDQFGELEHQRDETNQTVSGLVRQKVDDHLRDLQQRLVWDVWPALADAAEERDFEAARGHLRTARLLAEEAEHAEALWKETTVENFSFDPLTMTWPREFWLVLEEWRAGTAER